MALRVFASLYASVLSAKMCFRNADRGRGRESVGKIEGENVRAREADRVSVCLKERDGEREREREMQKCASAMLKARHDVSESERGRERVKETDRVRVRVC